MPVESKGPAYVKLHEAAVHAALESLEGWEMTGEGRAIERQFRFKSFTQAFSFMTEMAMLAEKMNHHPEWFNSYGRVDVRLTNHAARGLTDLDIHMAVMMNRAAARRDLKEN
jgi:4a-hydroxytetrahydrobiopterin dehydratase